MYKRLILLVLLSTVLSTVMCGQCGTIVLNPITGNLDCTGTASIGGSPPFSAITSGTNTGAAMQVSSGASITPTGTGTITATNVDGARIVSVNCPTVTGNGSTDDTVAMQACLDALPDFGILKFPRGQTYKITATLNLHARRGVILMGMSGLIGSLIVGSAAPSFVWYGADGGTVLSIQDVSNSIFQNFNIMSANGTGTDTAGADILIDVDQSGSPVVTMTDCQFIGLGLYGVRRRTTMKLLRFSAVSTNNVEKMTVTGHTTISCSSTAIGSEVGIGIDSSNSSNALKHLYFDNTIEHCATGINLSNGSADVIHNQLQSNSISVNAGGAYNINITDNDVENNKQFATISGPGKIVSGNRVSGMNPPSSHGTVDVNNGASMMLIGNVFDNSTANADIYCTAGGSVYAVGNSFSTNTAANVTGLTNCQGGTFLSNNKNLNQNSSIAGTLNSTSPASGLFQFFYETRSTSINDVSLSEGAAQSRSVLPWKRLGGVNTTYQVLPSDFAQCRLANSNASTPFTVTLVAVGSQPGNGQCFVLLNYGSGAITVSPSGQNINESSSSLVLPPGSATTPTLAFIWSDGSNYFASISNPLPGRVAGIHSITQTAAITTATLCATGACTGGLYEVKVVLLSTVSCVTPGPAVVALNLTWTDEGGTKTTQTIPLDDNNSLTLSSNLALGTTTGYAFGDIIIRSTGANPIQYATTYTACTTGTGTYNIDLTVEQKQ